MNRIQKLRKKAGLTQTQLADNIGISQNTLSQYESERRPVSSRVTLELSSFFNVSPAYLLGTSDEMQTTKEAMSSPADISAVKEVCEEYTANRVNLLLRHGWRILHVGADMDGINCYVLGWFGTLPAPRLDTASTTEDESPIWE